MPRGKYKHRNGQGFLNPTRLYTVMVDTTLYHKGHYRRAAVHAFKRAQKGYKGTPAPAEGKILVMMQDGYFVQGFHADGTPIVET